MLLAQTGVDSLQQVALARADRPVQHQRVNRLSWGLDDADCRSVGDAIARADDKVGQTVPAARGLLLARGNECGGRRLLGSLAGAARRSARRLQLTDDFCCLDLGLCLP